MRIRGLRAIITLAAAAVCLVAATAATAQDDHTAQPAKGLLRGKVLSDEGGAPIDGVIVTVNLDGRMWFSRSDAAGNFEVELAPGSYRVTLAHPRFDEENLLNVEIRSGSVNEFTTRMSPGANARSGPLEEIVVTGRYVPGAVDESRFSDSVLDVLGAEDFAVTGDSSVVDALARVTGVTIVDDKYVYVRGLGERYSATSFNKALLPSPDPARRVVPLDLFPSGVMEQLSVQKSWGAYLPADFSGGALEMTTRAIPFDRERNMKVSVGGNTQTTFQDANWYKGDSQDWTGFGGGFRDVPSEIDENSVDGRLPPPSLLTEEQIQAVGQSLNRDFNEYDKTIGPDLGLEMSWGETTETRVGNIGFLAGLRYKNDWDVVNDEIRRSSEPGPDNQPDVRNDFVQDQTTNTIALAGLGTLEWSPSDAHRLATTLFYTRRTDKRYINSRGFLRENERTVDQTFWEWEERALWSAQLTGDHLLEDLWDLHSDWGLTYSEATRDKPDTRFYGYEVSPTGALLFSNLPADNSRQWESLEDNAWDVYWNADVPVAWTDELLTTFQTGIKYFHKDRESDLRKFRYNPRFSSRDFARIRGGSPEEVFADENIGRGKWQLEEITQFTDSYSATEEILGTYLQLDNEIGADWRLTVGGRWETSTQTTETSAVQGGDPVVNELEEDFLLPSVALTWMFWEDMQLRASFSQTINRPDLREISPAPYLDAENRFEYIGNPDLQIAEINNYDLRWEWYHGGSDNIQLALFYKEFTAPIEETLLLKGSDVVRTYANAEQAELYGVELALRQGLGLFHESLEDFYVKFNGALIDSTVDVAASAVNQTNQSRPLQGQSPWVTSAQLTWDQADWDLQTTLAFNMAGERIADVGTNGLQDSYEQGVPGLDLVLRKGFEFQDQPMRVTLKAQNLLDPTYEIIREGIVERSYKTGRGFEISVSADF